MRITYYRFPDDTPEEVLLEHGCMITTINGDEVYARHIPEEKRQEVDYIDHTIQCSITKAKKLMKQYGGSGYTQHIDRDGGLFEVTEITLKGNNSRFKYNHHL